MPSFSPLLFFPETYVYMQTSNSQPDFFKPRVLGAGEQIGELKGLLGYYRFLTY